jgi:hypothetical protein
MEEPSLIIMDNASYHSTLEHKCRNGSWRKADIINWLTNNSIAFPQNVLKTELLAVHVILSFIETNHLKHRYVADKTPISMVMRCCVYLLITVFLTLSKIFGGIAKSSINFP